MGDGTGLAEALLGRPEEDNPKIAGLQQRQPLADRHPGPARHLEQPWLLGRPCLHSSILRELPP